MYFNKLGQGSFSKVRRCKKKLGVVGKPLATLKTERQEVSNTENLERQQVTEETASTLETDVELVTEAAEEGEDPTEEEFFAVKLQSKYGALKEKYEGHICNEVLLMA